MVEGHDIACKLVLTQSQISTTEEVLEDGQVIKGATPHACLNALCSCDGVKDVALEGEMPAFISAVCREESLGRRALVDNGNY